MEPFATHTGIVVPVDRVNVDTDAIIPKQFLKRVERTGFGQYLFFDWRFLDDGKPNPDFTLNQQRYQGASILISRANFGCGSSREHAPWALRDFGIRALLAPSFADIFHNNCFKNGLLPVQLSERSIDDLFARVSENPGYELTVNLDARTVSATDGLSLSFEVDEFRRKCLLEGLDDIGLTLRHEPQITAFEANRPVSPIGVGL